jgi:hypothetical protein
VLRHAASTDTPAGRLPSLIVPILAKTQQQRADCYRRFEQLGSVQAERGSEDPADGLAPSDSKAVRRRLRRTFAPWLVLVAMIFALNVPLAAPPSATSETTDVIVPQPPAGFHVENQTVTTVSDAYRDWRLALVAVPLALLGAYLALRWHWRRSLSLAEAGEAAFDPLDLGKLPFGSELFTSPALAGTAQQWRSYRRLRTPVLDMPRTVDATIASGGFFTPIVKERPITPTYLMLVEEDGRHDHIARLVDNMLRRLAGEGVSIETYHYQDSLALLRPSSRHGGAFSSLARIIATPESSLVIVGSGRALFIPMANILVRFVSREMNRWPRRAFLSTTPVSEWAERELALLHNGFAVGTAREDGVAALGRHIVNGFSAHRPLLESIVLDRDFGRSEPAPA